jgi:signal transduction histidine kinase/ligand-binding sensor domain-containing protein
LKGPFCDRLLRVLLARPQFGENCESIARIWRCDRNRLFSASLLAWLFCVILCVPAFSLDRDRSISQFHYTFWSEKDDAPSQINALAQTEDGYLWIGSSRGLFRFDGLRFEEYKPQPGVELPSHSIYSLTATPDGGLWIAFDPTGLGFLKDGFLTVFTKQGELPDSPVHCFARDLDGRIWAGTETGLALRQGDRWIPIGHDWNFTPEMIRYLLVDREGTLWVATIKTISFLKRGSKTFQLGGPIGSGVTTLAEAKDGRVWLADDGSLQVRPVPTAGHDSYAEGPAVVEDGLRQLLVDRDGALWITRLDSGVVRIRYPEKLGNRKYGSQDAELESFGAKDGFSPGFAFVLLEDREGNIWVGCSNGLARFRNNQVVPANLQQRYQSMTLLPARNGDLWIGALNDRPLLRIRGDSVVSEKVSARISSVLSAANGDVWWGTRTGIWRQRGTRFDFFALPKEATPDWIYEIIPGEDDGSLWIKLGDVGFVHFKQGVWDLHDWPRGVPSTGGTFRYGPSASYQDPSGRVWFGYTSGQVCLLDGKQVTVFSKNEGLDLGRIKVIRGLGQHIWVGGELGLMFFSRGRFLRVTGADGEPFGTISGIIETPDGGLWLNEMTGIIQIPAEEVRQFVADPDHHVDYRRFDYQDGLPGTAQMSFTNSTAVRTSDGRLWFATDNGLAWIDPAHLAKNLIPPPVSILAIGSERGRKPITSAVKFASGTQNVEIDYAGLSLSIPERVRFRYKLEDTDTDWQNVGTRRQAYYSNLGPGSYRFRVIARNNDGVWNDTGASIDFSIAPTYYQTAWFRVSCLAVFLALVWASYQLRIQELQHQFTIGAEARVKERTRIARELHDTLLQSFQGVTLLFQRARNLLPERTAEAMQTLDSALDGADEALAEGRDAIHDLRSPASAARGLAEEITALTEELVANDGNRDAVQSRVVIEGSAQTLHPDVHIEIYRIAREALRNAFKHSGGRRIETEIAYSESLFRLRIRDDGKGIDPNVRDRSERTGHWGLRGMRERTERLGGELNLWSEPGAGTEVELRIPGSIAYEAASARSGFRLFWDKMKDNHERPS